MRSRLVITAALALGLAPSGCKPTPAASGATPAASTAFAQFVDRYLDDFARRHPSIAGGNGLHMHDDLLDDLSAETIAREITALKRDREQLRAFEASELTPDERVDQKILDGIIDGWLLEQETVQNWKRNPMLYASALSDGVHNLMTMENAPAHVRMRRVISKLAGVPALLAAARTNITNPPAIFADRGVGMMRGAAAMLGEDLPLAFASEKGTPLMDSLMRAAGTAQPLITAYADYLEKDLMPRSNGDYKVGADVVARRYRAEELIAEPLPALIAIGERELAVYQSQFKAAAARLAPGRDAQEVWREVRRDHPKRGDVVAATQKLVDSLTAFVIAKGLAVVPEGERVVVAAAQPFDLGFASMHASPPLENPPVKSFYYITDASASMPVDQQEAWLERYNYASLINTSVHEAMPGHWLHSTYMRRTPGKVRRIWIGLNPFPQPSSGQDGWAHYSEQLMVEEKFGGGDPRIEMAQLSDALTRVCRLLSGIRVHAGEWSLADAQRCFEERAYVPTSAAKREAERATYDPTYGGYFLGKRGILTLRRDVQAKLGADFNLRTFHERLMTNGIAPIRAHRDLFLPGDTAAVIQ
ncbi:MAG TPA: DUF885 domain-containing protein [Gemmatimonadaceae bacterium]|nr:DUF885 domain-containing protein [Gemmatimonadaceae bacterium]